MILYVFADELMSVMYGSSGAAVFIKVMAPFFLLYYFQGPLQAVLQALNLAGAAMMNSLIGALVKTGLIFVLATRPSLGIMGAALAIVTGMVLVTLACSDSEQSAADQHQNKVRALLCGYFYMRVPQLCCQTICAVRRVGGCECCRMDCDKRCFLYHLAARFPFNQKDELRRIPIIGRLIVR